MTSRQPTIGRATVRLLAIMLLMNVARAQEVDDGGKSQALGAESIAPIIDLEPVDIQRQRTVPIRVYLATGDQPRPVVLVSHGLGGSRDGKAYLGRNWSQAGFTCVFLQHTGSDREVIRTARPSQRMATLRQAANATNNLARIKDVSFVIDQLQAWNEHHAFGDERLWGRAPRAPNHHPVIVAISTKFWHAYLEDDAAAKRWLQSQQPRTDAKLAGQDVWQWK